jgi:3-hydroxyacyl-[acyl-carrier-protein] dehydratase
MPRATIHFARAHPALVGHFPGRPIVPGVLLLDAVQDAIEAGGLTLAGIAAAKFLSPAVPDEPLSVDYEADGSTVRFEIGCGARKVASGRFLLAEDVNE